MFVENKKPKSDIAPRLSDDGEVQLTSSRSNDLRYISALNTRRNPDLLVPGGKFLKGNQYFKGDDPLKQLGSADEKSSIPAGSDKEEDSKFDRMM